MKIIGFDPMKLQKDVLASQVNKTLITNLLSLVKNNFPGTTHIALSVPINTNQEMIAHGTTPSPLSIEDFTTLWLDAIHTMGYNVVLRGTDCECEKIYNFPLGIHPGQYFVSKGIDFLTRMKGHLKDGDVCGLYPELEGHIWDGTGACINDTGDQNADYNNFYALFIQEIKNWSNQNNIKIQPFITINRSEAINGWMHESNFQAMGAVVYDYYGDTQTIQEMHDKTEEMFTKYNIPIYQQEWGDTRPIAAIQSDPTHTAQMADQVFFPELEAGHMSGIDFWNLFDTPQEGIVTISGDSVSLNAKGTALAQVFQKWFGTQPTPTPVPPTPPPPPTPTPPPVSVGKLPAFTINGTISLSSDGKGNLSFTLNAEEK